MAESGKTRNQEIAEIVRQLKQVMHQHGWELDRLEATQSPEGAPWGPGAALSEVVSRARINPHLPIAWPNWPKGLLPKIKAILQKLVRRSLRWYIDPIVEQQNDFNAAVASALHILWQDARHLQAQLTQEEQRESSDGE